jgi:DNA repair exonuclease SbcCD ATPase subunit
MNRGENLEEAMPDEGESVVVEQQSTAGKWILLVLAIVFVVASVYGYVSTQQRVQKLTSDLSASQTQVAELQKRMRSAEAEEETLGEKLGLTKKELAQRAAELQAQEKAAESRLESAQKASQEQLGQVSGELAGVKTDVGGVKTDAAATRADLDATKQKLQSTIGDLGVQSGLIAHTQQDLEVLKHKGDRNYYEFTLLKGAKPQAVATVTLQLKKTDEKRGKFTMNVTSDDRTIEKKDRNVSEPIQFYSGRDHMLFELVVWTVDKKKATGYLSTPKSAPVPVTAN